MADVELNGDEQVVDLDKQLEEFSEWIEESERICFFLGAGMSVASDIPTFRGKFGLWTFGKDLMRRFCIIILILIVLSIIIPLIPITVPAILFFFCLCCTSPCLPFIGLILVGTPTGWNNIPGISWLLFKYFFYDVIEKAKPNDGHKFIRDLQLKYPRKKIFIITQNVDALEEKAEFDGDIYQLHGNYYNFYCRRCNELHPRHFAGNLLPKRSPRCRACNRRTLRTGCLLFMDRANPFHFPFGQARAELRAMDRRDLFIIIGTSATVEPACSYPQLVECRIVEINITPHTSFAFLGEPGLYDGEGFMYVMGEQDKILGDVRKRLKGGVELESVAEAESPNKRENDKVVVVEDVQPEEEEEEVVEDRQDGTEEEEEEESSGEEVTDDDDDE